MNEQLRKAILDAATLEEIVIKDNMYGTIHTDCYRRQAVDASQAKLLRVIEVLVEQRNHYIDCWLSCSNQMDGNIYTSFDLEEEISDEDAELIAALEEK